MSSKVSAFRSHLCDFYEFSREFQIPFPRLVDSCDLISTRKKKEKMEISDTAYLSKEVVEEGKFLRGTMLRFTDTIQGTSRFYRSVNCMGLCHVRCLEQVSRDSKSKEMTAYEIVLPSREHFGEEIKGFYIVAVETEATNLCLFRLLWTFDSNKKHRSRRL